MKLISLLMLIGVAAVAAAEEPAGVVQSHPVVKGVYMLTGQGGNIGVSVGEDGAFLIDDQFAPLTDEILAEVRKLTDQPVRFVINTHAHGDHTGGNENLGEADALIVAHDNVRRVMASEEFIAQLKQNGVTDVAKALPVVTFNDQVTFHLNGYALRGQHFAHAHTNGDTVIWFDGGNAVHMGDIYFNVGFPFVDRRLGGSVAGVIAAVKEVLGAIDDQTKVIPGHGALSDKRGLQEYLGMLEGAQAAVMQHVRRGDSLEATLAARPLQPYESRWNWAFIDADEFVTVIYNELSSD